MSLEIVEIRSSSSDGLWNMQIIILIRQYNILFFERDNTVVTPLVLRAYLAARLRPERIT
jgi:hypothetical protein